jgi:CRISPR-associated protein Cas2
MYVIVVYDIEEKRITKVLKYLRGYLNWVQNSVFEGELTQEKFKEVQIGIKKMIKTEKDSVIFYQFSDESQVVKEVMGVEKSGTDVML